MSDEDDVEAVGVEGGEAGPAAGGTVAEVVPTPEASDAVAFPPGEGGLVTYRRRWYHTVEESVPVLAIAVMVLLPLCEIVARRFGTGIPGAAPFTQHLTLWVAFLGAGGQAAGARHRPPAAAGHEARSGGGFRRRRRRRGVDPAGARRPRDGARGAPRR